MKALHFGAGNIGRGFIGEVLYENRFETAFVDVNAEVIDALNEFNEYTIELAQEDKKHINIKNVRGINNGTHPEEVIEVFETTDIVTTAIGANILPIIAPLIAEGIQNRMEVNSTQPLDILACENMIGGSDFLKGEVTKHLSEEEIEYLEQYIGFPNAAVDRIVPLQSHEDKLFVLVEPYREWVVDASTMKNKELRLAGVNYAENLQPYIERKLFTVNTGHAATAYNGKFAGYKTIDEALENKAVKAEVRNVLEETGALMIEKWNFDADQHQSYIEKIISRFSNPHISDHISRVGRTPIRKLGYDERFIRPMREAYERNLSVDHLINTVAKVFVYRDDLDEESQKLAQLLTDKPVEEVIRVVTGLDNETLIKKIAIKYNELI